MIGVLFLLGGCATNGGPFDANFWVEKGASVSKVFKDKTEEVVKEVVTPVPNPYRDWGWTPTEYQALLDCEAKGGKMGSSKHCRGAK